MASPRERTFAPVLRLTEGTRCLSLPRFLTRLESRYSCVGGHPVIVRSGSGECDDAQPAAPASGAAGAVIYY